MGAKELDRVAFVLQTEVEMQDPMPFPRTGKRMDTQNEKKSEGLQNSQMFEFIREGDDRGSQCFDQRGVRILEKLIRQDPKKP